jgi:hypothetical protein
MGDLQTVLETLQPGLSLHLCLEVIQNHNVQLKVQCIADWIE